jgi:hypothetical protein
MSAEDKSETTVKAYEAHQGSSPSIRPSWTSKAESVCSCPNCQQPIRLYRRQNGDIYAAVGGFSFGPYYKQVTVHDEPVNWKDIRLHIDLALASIQDRITVLENSKFLKEDAHVNCDNDEPATPDPLDKLGPATRRSTTTG